MYPTTAQARAILNLSIIIYFSNTLVFCQFCLFPKRCTQSAIQFTLMCPATVNVIVCSAPHSSTHLYHKNFLSVSRPLCPPPSHLVCSHLALGTLVRLQALTERTLNRLHFSGNGLEGLLIMLLPLQSFIQTLLLLTDLGSGRNGMEGKSEGCELERNIPSFVLWFTVAELVRELFPFFKV